MGVDYFGNKGKKLSKEHKRKAAENRYKIVLQFDLDGNFIQEWESATLVCKLNNWNRGNIHNCCRGKQKTSYGYKWKYKK